MYKNRVISVLLLIAVFITMTFCGKYYFTLFTNEIENFSQRDAFVLNEYNSEIIEKLQRTENTDDWQAIIDSYEEIIVHIEDSSGNIIAATTGREWSRLDVKIQNPFKFDNEAYMIRSSVYFLRGYLTDATYLYRFIILVLVIISLLSLLSALIIYTFMLRPVYRLYDNIELYEHGMKPKRSVSHSQIAQLQNRFVTMTETIDKEQQNQRRIIASISHDIKTPLTSIMGYSELLNKENLTEERKQRYINTIYQRSTDIKGLIDDFDEYLSYNMASALKKKKITVAEMMERLTDGYEEELNHFGVKFICDINDSDEYVDVDVAKMRRVFGNIISNSTKHFKSEIRIIEVECEEDGKNLTITLSDNGEGVEDDKLDMIFEPLYTSDEGRKVAGLGLAICREIIEGHNGTIYARKSKYGGLAVVIKLKLVK